MARGLALAGWDSDRPAGWLARGPPQSASRQPWADVVAHARAGLLSIEKRDATTRSRWCRRWPLGTGSTALVCTRSRRGSGRAVEERGGQEESRDRQQAE